MSELWRRLRIGDEVRVVSWPEELRDDLLRDDDARELYQWLIDTQYVLKVVEIDAWGLPYAKSYKNDAQGERWDYLALNHGGLEIVQPGSDRDLVQE